MTKTRATLGLVLAGLMLTACGAVRPGTSIPPINIPSFSIPSFSIPSIPPIVLPPGVSIPPINLPSADAGSGLCTLISPAEMGAILGGSVTVTSSESTSCTYTGTSLASVVIRTETGELSTAKFLMGDSAQDITIGPYPAVSGVFFGGPLVYIQKGSEQLVVQGVLIGEDDAARAKILQIAQTVGSRW